MRSKTKTLTTRQVANSLGYDQPLDVRRMIALGRIPASRRTPTSHHRIPSQWVEETIVRQQIYVTVAALAAEMFVSRETVSRHLRRGKFKTLRHVPVISKGKCLHRKEAERFKHWYANRRRGDRFPHLSNGGSA